MESLQVQQEILKLGKKLVEELRLSDSTDTLSRWMAHYLAELMHIPAELSPEAQAARTRECFDTILQLWEKRNAFPSGIQPLRELLPALEMLQNITADFERHEFLYMMSEDNPWVKFGWQVHYGQKNILNLLMYLQSLDVNFVNVQKWVSDHGPMITEEEKILTSRFDQVVQQTKHYFGFPDETENPLQAQQKILENIEKAITSQAEAFKHLKADLAKSQAKHKMSTKK